MSQFREAMSFYKSLTLRTVIHKCKLIQCLILISPDKTVGNNSTLLQKAQQKSNIRKCFITEGPEGNYQKCCIAGRKPAGSLTIVLYCRRTRRKLPKVLYCRPETSRKFNNSALLQKDQQEVIYWLIQSSLD